MIQAARGEAGWSQRLLAERAETSQQWISRVERGAVDPRLSRIERLLGVLGRRLAVESAAIPATASDDPDLVDEAEAARLLDFYVPRCDILWKRLDTVPHVLAGRLAALAQGLHVRPARVDLRIAEKDAAAVSRALSTLLMPRWHERLQMYVGNDPFLDAPGPLRWFAADLAELRIEIVPSIEVGLTVSVDQRSLPVVPLGELLATDADIARLWRRADAAARPVGGRPPAGRGPDRQSIE
ncbi:helix-turn-helix transcriptional regulator [Actinoplanes sp. NPDC049802]|uniref:helix-turn-helix domain-containing protein n=1 Tax=Actinoplanes sp. NPDC049802 TaxID=3154742 RepID=UPI0033D17CFF